MLRLALDLLLAFYGVALRIVDLLLAFYVTALSIGSSFDISRALHLALGLVLSILWRCTSHWVLLSIPMGLPFVWHSIGAALSIEHSFGILWRCTLHWAFFEAS
jgi:hypothetical protein